MRNFRSVMSSCNFKVLSVLLFGICSVVTHAQTPAILIDTQTPSGVTVCGAAVTFTINLQNQTTGVLSGVKLYPEMPTGMKYVTLSETGMAFSSSAPSLNFTLTDLQPSEQRQVTFQATADCDLIAYLRNNSIPDNLVNNKTKVTYDAGLQVLEPNGSESYNVLYPELELFVPELQKNMQAEFLNVVKSRDITITNSGLGTLSSLDFFLKADPQLQFQSLELVSGSGSTTLVSNQSTADGLGFTISNFAAAGDGDAVFEEGESLTLRDFVKVIAEKASVQTTYKVLWGCGVERCNASDPQATFSVYIEAIGGKPAMQLSHQVLQKTDLCSAPPSEVLIQSTNNGSGNTVKIRDAAFNVLWELVESIQNHPEMTRTHTFYIRKNDNTLVDITSLSVSVDNGTSRSYRMNLDNVFASDVDGPGGLDDLDADGSYDDLNAGATFSFIVRSKYGFNGVAVPSPISILSFYGHLRYRNWSGIEESYYPSGITSVDYGSVRVNTVELSGNTDLTEGSPLNLNFSFDGQQSLSALSQTNSSFSLDLVVPPGVTLTGASWIGTSLPFTQTGNAVTISHPLSRSVTKYDIALTFQLNCSAATGPQNDQIILDFYYYDNPACPDTKYRLAHIQKAAYIHCASCSTVETTSFVAERTTLGWVVPTGSRLFYTYNELFGPVPSAQKVTASTPGVKTDVAYAGDEVQVRMHGNIGGSATAVNNLSAQIKYTSPIAEEFLQYVSARFFINGTEHALPGTFQPVRTASDNRYTYDYSIPLGTNGIPIQLLSGTSFELRVKYQTSDMSAVSQGKYSLSEFRGVFSSIVNGQEQKCLDFGDEFYFLRDRFSPVINTSALGYSLTEEGEIYLGNYSVSPAQLGAFHDFPNEYRPIAYPENFTVTLPAGFIFDTSKPIYIIGDFSWGHNFTGAQYSNQNRTVTLPKENLPLLRRGMTLYGYIKVDCENPNNTFVPVTNGDDIRVHSGTFGYRKKAYLPVSQHQSSPATTINFQMYNGRRPNLQLTANSQQEGYSDHVKWPVQLCNPFLFYASNSKQTWIAVELKEDDNSSMITGATDGNDNPLPVQFYGPKDSDHPNGRYMFVEVGEIAKSACYQLNIVAKYKNCQEDLVQEFDILASWDYFAYPDVSGHSGSVRDRKAGCEAVLLENEFSLKYKNAALQWTVTENYTEPVNLCQSLPFDIELKSTKYADMDQLKVWFDLPDNTALDTSSPSFFFYPVGSTARVIPLNAFIDENGQTGVDITTLIGGDLPGTRLTHNKIGLALNLKAACGFDPGTPIKFRVTGFTNCGDPVSYVDQRKIKLNGFNLDDLELTLTASEEARCNEDNNITLSIKNNGLVSSDANILEVFLPEGTDYVSMVQGDLGNPLVSQVGSQTRLQWMLPAGYVGSTQTKALTFNTMLDYTPEGTPDILFTARTAETGNAICAEGNIECVTEGTSGRAELMLQVKGLSTLTVTYLKYLCAYQFGSSISEPGCRITSYAWDFGDGGTSSDGSPFHAFNPGTYTVSLTVTFNCDGCGGYNTKQIQLVVEEEPIVLVDQVISADVPVTKKVIQVSASTFSDSWPLGYQENTLDERNSFLNGSQGVWRNDAVYVYEKARESSASVDISKDGTFSVDQFSWKNADHELVPNWVKATAITLYSPYSYELENKDVLGVYSAALYDYGGHLPSANGVNMRNDEMAFTSFEFLDGNITGNWVFGNKAVSTYSFFDVYSAKKNVAIVKASMQQLASVDRVDIFGRGPWIFGNFGSRYTQDNLILCRQQYPENPEWTILVFQRSFLSGHWTGRIRIKHTPQDAVAPDIDPTFAHTGRSSLRVYNNKVFRQPTLSLDSGKTYFVTCWVSVKKPQVSTPHLADNIGYDVLIKNKSGTLVQTSSFSPSGPVIEGWQQVKGTFTSTVNNAQLELRFKSGSFGVAWYDDLRLHPEKGNMKSFVYDLKDYRLQAILDEQNFASFFYYDQEGHLYLTKKETEDGVKTLTENITYQVEK